MQYMGGKSKLAKHIAEVVASVKGDKTTYIEPFIGGGSVFEKVAPMFERRWGGDICEDLVLMWQAVADGWLPPSEMSEEVYRQLKTSEPSAFRAFAGFGCSFGGKWFGGYAKSVGRSHVEESARNVCKASSSYRNSTFKCTPYHEWQIDSTCFVYADPPYANTQGYSTGKFDHVVFWNTMEEWTNRGATVLVSEFTAPLNWTAVWERESKRYLSKQDTTRPTTIEKLWLLK